MDDGNFFSVVCIVGVRSLKLQVTVQGQLQVTVQGQYEITLGEGFLYLLGYTNWNFSTRQDTDTFYSNICVVFA